MLQKPTSLRFSIDIDAEDLIRELESRLQRVEPDRTPIHGKGDPPYLTRKDAANLMGVSERQLDHLRAAGRIGWIKNGRRVLLKRQDIDTFLNAGYCNVEVSR